MSIVTIWSVFPNPVTYDFYMAAVVDIGSGRDVCIYMRRGN